jgi:hypothetical protein
MTVFIMGTGFVFAESVGGISLGMSKKDVLSAYGKPTKVLSQTESRNLCGYPIGGWYYQKDGWLITFNSNSGQVDRIVIFGNGTRRLDNSGLNCSSSLEEFAAKYGLSRVPRQGSIVSIDDGEYLVFFEYPNSLMFTIYNN